MQKTPMTRLGKQQLQHELATLKARASEVIEQIAIARAHGDLKENAEYHAAREQQGFIEARKREVEAKLSSAEVIDLNHVAASNRVVFGSTVKLYRDSDDREFSYQIVGEDEADIEVGKISYASPIAKSIIGKSVDDDVIVETPSGEITYTILSVSYEEDA